MALNRGDVAWALFYKDKSRPGVVVRHDVYAASDNITLCPITSVISGSPLRPRVARGKGSGLRKDSEVMVYRIATLPPHRVRDVIGRLTAAELRAVDAALKRWLDLT
jgi:mRNA interferase MazF